VNVWSLVSVRPLGQILSQVASLAPDGLVRDIPVLRSYPELVAVLDDWEGLSAELSQWEVADGEVLDGVELLAPLRYPRKLICAGANYVDHLKEMGITEVPDGMEPYFFLLPATTIVGPVEPVVIPDDPDYRVDWEAELAVVMGRRGHHLTAGQAVNHVAGYTIMNDISARGRHARKNPLAPPFAYDWLGSKGLDTFTPIGPGLTPTWFVPDPQDLRVRLWLNGELKQDGATNEMIFSVAELVAAASRVMTLEPGDVIATGTPAGVGVARGESIGPGDELIVEIPPLGRITNPVRLAASDPAHTSHR
jgi:2,4-diketo-3-deoxy-L-fuconate hydrolase